MKSDIPDRDLIRQYLLGRLDENKELENNVSETILFRDDVSEIADSIEDEITEEYLEGKLDPADKTAVNEYFLRPAERREKLRFYKLLQSHFEATHDRLSSSPPELVPVGGGAPMARAARTFGSSWGSHSGTYAQFAALALLCIVSLGYIASLRSRQTRLEADLAHERERSADLATEVSQLQPSMIPLTLVTDRSRDSGGQLPRIWIKPSTQRIIVEIALPKGAIAPCDVRLERKSAKTPIWTATLLPITSASGDARLVFDVPAQGIESDIYSFVVSLVPPDSPVRQYYDFEARVTK